jgi:hypothetical protein
MADRQTPLSHRRRPWSCESASLVARKPSLLNLAARKRYWIPACAGMTLRRENRSRGTRIFSGCRHSGAHPSHFRPSALRAIIATVPGLKRSSAWYRAANSHHPCAERKTAVTPARAGVQCPGLCQLARLRTHVTISTAKALGSCLRWDDGDGRRCLLRNFLSAASGVKA